MKSSYIKAVLIGLVVLAMYIPTFIWMWDRWFAEESYYSHGILMPLVTIFLIMFKKEELKGIGPKRNVWGLLLIGLALAIHLISAWMRVYFTSGFSMILLILGLVLYFLGVEYLKKTLAPILFLIFMVPMPLVLIANLSVKMKLFAAQWATVLINKIGIPATRDGSTINTIHSYMMVEGPCSGLRSLISLLALGALVAYFMKANWIKKVILLILTVPISICANIFRITLLTSVSEIYGEKFAMGWFHDFSGFLLFAVALLGLIIAKEIIE
jgi:exosortase